jgi:hypothetical protein
MPLFLSFFIKNRPCFFKNAGYLFSSFFLTKCWWDASVFYLLFLDWSSKNARYLFVWDVPFNNSHIQDWSFLVFFWYFFTILSHFYTYVCFILLIFSHLFLYRYKESRRKYFIRYDSNQKAKQIEYGIQNVYDSVGITCATCLYFSAKKTSRW